MCQIEILSQSDSHCATLAGMTTSAIEPIGTLPESSEMACYGTVGAS